jgi:hypothetical protein
VLVCNDSVNRILNEKLLIFSFMCMFCRLLFVLCSFFFWPLCCLFFFNIRIMITSLVSSSSSYLRYLKSQQKRNFDKIFYLFKESDVLFVWVLFKTNTMGLVMGTSSVSSTDVITPWQKRLSYWCHKCFPSFMEKDDKIADFSTWNLFVKWSAILKYSAV